MARPSAIFDLHNCTGQPGGRPTSLSLSLILSLCLSVSLSLSLSISLTHPTHPHPPPIHPSICPCINPSIRLSICLSVCLAVCLFVCLCLSSPSLTSLPAYLPTHPRTHPPTLESIDGIVPTWHAASRKVGLAQRYGPSARCCSAWQVKLCVCVTFFFGMLVSCYKQVLQCRCQEVFRNASIAKMDSRYTSTEPCVMCAGAIYWSQARFTNYQLPLLPPLLSKLKS